MLVPRHFSDDDGGESADGFLRRFVFRRADCDRDRDAHDDDGQVDAGTYAGWKLFHSSCHGCHGVGGVGTGIAPNLVDKIGNYTPRGFATKVLSSYRIVPMSPDSGPPETLAEREALLELVMKRERQQRGQPLMPAWDADLTVAPHVLDLYAYLSARADGGLGPGKPKLLPAPPR